MRERESERARARAIERSSERDRQRERERAGTLEGRKKKMTRVASNPKTKCIFILRKKRTREVADIAEEVITSSTSRWRFEEEVSTKR